MRVHACVEECRGDVVVNGILELPTSRFGFPQHLWGFLFQHSTKGVDVWMWRFI